MYTHPVTCMYASFLKYIHVYRWLFANILCDVVCVTTSVYSVGNKNDASPEKKVVKTEDAQKFAEQIGVPLYETSAKENQNVEEVLAYAHASLSVSISLLICTASLVSLPLSFSLGLLRDYTTGTQNQERDAERDRYQRHNKSR